MRPHEESHSNDLQKHFNSVYDQEDQINFIRELGHKFHFVVQRQEYTVNNDDYKNHFVEPGIDGN